MSLKQALILVQIDKITYFINYNAGKYVKEVIVLILL